MSAPIRFIATKLVTLCRVVMRFYNKVGSAEQLVEEGKQAVTMTRLAQPGSCADT